jgi:hypothetical protein
LRFSPVIARIRRSWLRIRSRFSIRILPYNYFILYLFPNSSNIFDEEYLTSAFFSATAGRNLASYGDRRTFGIQVKSEF